MQEVGPSEMEGPWGQEDLRAHDPLPLPREEIRFLVDMSREKCVKNKANIVVFYVKQYQNMIVMPCKVHIFWEGHKILQNIHLTFDCMYCGQKQGEDFAKFCGLLRIYELYRLFFLRLLVQFFTQIYMDRFVSS